MIVIQENLLTALMSVIDFLLLHPNDIQNLLEFKILEFNEFSDHTPWLFSLKSKSLTRETVFLTCQDSGSGDQIRYDDAKVPVFRSKLMNNYDDFTTHNQDSKQRLFKCSYDIISKFLNRLFANGEYPTAWAEGIIVPVFSSPVTY